MVEIGLWIQAVVNLEKKFKHLSEMGQWPWPGMPFKEFTDPQYKFLRTLGMEGNVLYPVGFQGAVGGGKTFSLVSKILVAASIPKNRVVVYRKYQKDLMDTTFGDTFKQLVEALGICRALLVDKRDNPRTILTNGSEVYWRGLFTASSKREAARLGSTQFGAIFIEEATEIEDEKVVKTLLARPRWPHARGFYTIGLCYNPPPPAHWLERWRKEKKIKVIECPLEANLENLPEHYYATLNEHYDATWRAKYIEGQTSLLPQGSPAYEISDFHFRQVSYNPNLPLVRGWDLGSNVGACIIGQYDGQRLALLKLIILADSWTRPLVQEVTKWCLLNCPGYQERPVTDFVDGVSLKQRHSSSEWTNEDIMLAEGITPIGVTVRHAVRQERINDFVQRVSSDGYPLLIISDTESLLFTALSTGYCIDHKGNIVKDGYYEHIGDAFTFLFFGLMSHSLMIEPLQIRLSLYSEDTDSSWIKRHGYTPAYAGQR